MRLFTVIPFLFLTINLPVFSGCVTLSKVGSAHLLAQPAYTFQQDDAQTTTINDVTVQVEILHRSNMFHYPQLFAFDPTWLPGYPKAYVNLYHYYPYSNGVSWGYLFGISEEYFSLPAFFVTIKNNSSHAISLRSVYAFLVIDNSYNVPPLLSIQELKNVLHEIEVAFENRPANSFLEIRRPYPVGVLPLLVEIKRPFLRFFDHRSLILPNQEYVFLVVFPTDFPKTAMLSFFGIPTKFSPAGEVLERSNFQFETTKGETSSTSQR